MQAIDDAHPLDWYPEDAPESRTLEEAESWVERTLTRRQDVVKLREAPAVLATPPRPNTTNLTREIVMPFHDTVHAPLAWAFASRATELRRIAAIFDSLAAMPEQEARRAASQIKALGELLQRDADRLRLLIPMTPGAQELMQRLEAARVRKSRGQGAAPRVYFFGCATCDLVKIGVSRDYRLRMDDLHRATEHVLHVMGSFEGDRQAEAEVHALFKDDRVEGEWFRTSERLVAFIGERRTKPTDMPVLRARRHWR